METSDRSKFEQCALASGLLTEEQLSEARTCVGWSDGDESNANTALTDQQLAERLVKMEQLNPWQAKQLLDGRTKFNLGKYEIIDSIGQGGMGQVFKAEHSLLGRLVAIKVLPLSKTTPESIANFTREIRALASFDHERLVRALDADQDGNVYYLVTEYIPGTDLRKLVRRESKLDAPTAASIISQVAEGVLYAHEQGIIHRDIKPGNVLVTPTGEAKLSDLGLAGPLEGGAESDPRYGKIVGTADYISPDHVKSPWDPTPGWDIYSLGCTLYYAVTGKVPFPGGTTADKIRAHCELRPLDPRRLNEKLSDEFADVMADMMAKNPGERIQTALEVIQRLAPWASGGSQQAENLKSRIPNLESPITPPVIAKPPSSTRRGSGTTGPGDAALCDTLSDFTALPESDSGQDDSPSVIVPTPDTGGSWRAEVGHNLAGSKAVLRPLLLLLLTPVALVGVVMFVWWLISVWLVP